MTEFDKKLIEKANAFSRYEWNNVSVLVSIADTEEGAQRLRNIMYDLQELIYETVF